MVENMEEYKEFLGFRWRINQLFSGSYLSDEEIINTIIARQNELAELRNKLSACDANEANQGCGKESYVEDLKELIDQGTDENRDLWKQIRIANKVIARLVGE